MIEAQTDQIFHFGWPHRGIKIVYKPSRPCIASTSPSSELGRSSLSQLYTIPGCGYVTLKNVSFLPFFYTWTGLSHGDLRPDKSLQTRNTTTRWLKMIWIIYIDTNSNWQSPQVRIMDFYRKNIGTTWKIWVSAETVNRVWTLIGWPSLQWGRRHKGCWETEAIPGGCPKLGWRICATCKRLVSDKSVSDTEISWDDHFGCEWRWW